MNVASSSPEPSSQEDAQHSPGTAPAAGSRWWMIGIPLLVAVGYFAGHASQGNSANTSGASGFGGQVSGGSGGNQGGSQAPGGRGSQGSFSGSGQGGTSVTGGQGTSVQSNRTAGQGGSGAVVAVQVSPAKAGILSATRSATGTVTTAQQTVVSARVAGTVTALPVQVGDTVNSGQTVVGLSSTDLISGIQSAQNTLDTARVQLRTQQSQTTGSRAQLQAAFSAAQTTLSNAQTTLSAQQQLYAIGAISQTDLNTARAQVQQAQSTLSSAQNALSDNGRAGSEVLASLQLAVLRAQIALAQTQQAASEAKIAAPFAGQVTALSVTGGQYLNAGTAAFTLTSTQRQVSFSAPPSQAAALHIGQQLPFTIGQTKSILKITANAGAPVNGNVQLVGRFVSGSASALGTVGSVTYPVTVAQGTLVPSTALLIDTDKTSVFAVVSSKARQITVSVLGQAGTLAAVSGLDGGLDIITQPPSGLLDGTRVTTDAAGARAGGSGGATDTVGGASTGGAQNSGFRRGGSGAGQTGGQGTSGSGTSRGQSRVGQAGSGTNQGQSNPVQSAPGQPAQNVPSSPNPGTPPAGNGGGQ